MYSVSDAYKIAVADNHRKSKMRAVLKIGSNVINMDDNDIIKDTVYIANQCTNGNEYEYGCVYAAECGITIKSSVDIYALYDAELRVYWSLWTGSEWEEIPLGVFYVSETNRINDKISIKALDAMTKLDPYTTENTTGTMPQLMAYIAEKCGVELAQTQEELATFPNADFLFSVEEDKVDCYRDLLAYLGMVTASFGVFDRFGKLKLVQYATEPCVELGRKQRFKDAGFSDYITAFIGIKARFIATENYSPYKVGGDGVGLVLDMGDIPIVRGLPETKTAVLETVYDVLKNVSYTPCEFETLGNPALDLGDYMRNVGVGSGGNEYISPITYSYWTYRGKHKLKAVGGNPKLAGVTKLRDKYTKSLEGEIQAKSIVVKEYRNSDEIVFKGKATEIARLNFAATENSKPIFLLCVRLNTDLDGVLVLQFCMDGVADEARLYRQYLSRGDNYITIADIYTVENNERHTVNIMASMEYFESDTRKHAAEVQTQKNFMDALSATGATVSENVVVFPSYDVAEIDKTVASATIKKGEVCAILYGQGVAGEGKWDGTLNFNENINVSIDFKGNMSFDIDNFRESIITGLQTPIGGAFTESMGSVPFTGVLSFANITAFPDFVEVIKDYVFNTSKAELYTFDEYITTNNDMFALKTIYNFESTEQSIDSGKMCSLALDYSGLTVESVVVENG